ncbi:uncharacterized protein LOC135350464 isoform X1 [Halichondria panicea]|uniref:uncharacterized protein LOC135350464 isoform X1 n=1 Tax=Halichondria panicea TaxID=6063 RepID=UPI00312BC1B0
MQIRACYTGQVRFLLPVVGKQRYQERLDVPKSRFISFCDPTDVCKKGVATNMQIRACYAGKSGFYSRSSGSKIPRKTRCPKNQDTCLLRWPSRVSTAGRREIKIPRCPKNSDSYYSVIRRTCAKKVLEQTCRYVPVTLAKSGFYCWSSGNKDTKKD